MPDIDIKFKAAPTVGRFMESAAFFRLIAGPVGSGKTTGCIYETARRAFEQAKAPDGIRYTRFAIVRQTLKQLKDTVLKDIEAQLKGLARYKVSDNTIYINFGDIHSEWLLIPLDDPEDQRRLLSMQLTGAWLSEAIEMNTEIVEPVLGRCGRYPSKANGGPSWFGAIADTNMPTEGDPWHKLMEAPPPEWQIFIQPGGRHELAENLENLPGGREYYNRLARGHSPEWVTRYVDAEYGPDPAGSAVHRNTFKRDFHTVSLKKSHPIFGNKPISDGIHLKGLNKQEETNLPRESTFDEPKSGVLRGVGDSIRTGLTATGMPRATLMGYGFDKEGEVVGDGRGGGWRGLAEAYALEPSHGYPLIVTQDFGRNPCALIGQMDHKGRALILEEIVSEDMGLQLHIEQNLMPALNSSRFVGRPFYVIGDPAGLAKNTTFEESSFDTLKSHGLKAFPAPTNDQRKRIAAVDNLLLQQRDGGPALIVDADRCPVLVQALTAKYRYARRRSGQYAPLPEKLHPWSDVADDLQYFCLVVQGGFHEYVANKLRGGARSDKPARPRMPVRAWT
jgi:hypothetical protein